MNRVKTFKELYNTFDIFKNKLNIYSIDIVQNTDIHYYKWLLDRFGERKFLYDDKNICYSETFSRWYEFKQKLFKIILEQTKDLNVLAVEKETSSLSETIKRTGTDTTDTTGTDTTDTTGTDTSKTTGTDISKTIGTDTTDTTGTDTSKTTGTDKIKTIGTDITDTTGTETIRETDTSNKKEQIDNLGGNQDVKPIFDRTRPITGKIGLESGTDTFSNVDNTKSGIRTPNIENKRTADLSNERTANLQDQRIANLRNKRTADLSNERTANLQDQRTADLRNKRTADLENKRTLALQDLIMRGNTKNINPSILNTLRMLMELPDIYKELKSLFSGLFMFLERKKRAIDLPDTGNITTEAIVATDRTIEQAENQFEINKKLWYAIENVGPGPGPIILPRTNALLSFRPNDEGGINQYRINVDNKDNINSITNRVLTNENKILGNETKINENKNNIGRLQNNLNTTNRNVESIEQAEQTLRVQVSANTRLSNNNKTRIDNLPIGSSTFKNRQRTDLFDFRFNRGVLTDDVEFWNNGIKMFFMDHTHNTSFNKPIIMLGNKITDLGNPTWDTDAATKKYVDDNSGGTNNPTFKDNRTHIKDVDLKIIDASTRQRTADKKWIFSQDNIEMFELGKYLHKSLKSLSMNGNKITNLSDGTLPRDAMNKRSVERLITNTPFSAKFKDNLTKTTDIDFRKVVDSVGNTDIELWHNNTPIIRFDVYNLGSTKRTSADFLTPVAINDSLNLGRTSVIKNYKSLTGDYLIIYDRNKIQFNTTGNDNFSIKSLGTFGLSNTNQPFLNIGGLNNPGVINNLDDATLPGQAMNKRSVERLIANIGGIKKFSVVVKNNRQPFIVDNTTGENITLSTIPSGLKTQIEILFPDNSIINNGRWKVLGEFVSTPEDIQSIGDGTNNFMTIAGLIVPNDPSPIDNMIYIDVFNQDFNEPGTTYNTTQYHLSQQIPSNNTDKWNYIEYQSMENLFMLIHMPKYNSENWDQPHLKRKFEMDFESQLIDNRKNYVSLETQMKNMGQLYLISGGEVRLSKAPGQQKIDIMTKINVEKINNSPKIKNLKIYFQKMLGNRTALNRNNFTFIEPGNGTKLTFILEEHYES